jgi:hypothetical protein
MGVPQETPAGSVKDDFCSEHEHRVLLDVALQPALGRRFRRNESSLIVPISRSSLTCI